MSEAATEITPRERLAAAMAKHGITITSEFVPFSKSRHAKPDKDGKVWRSLNWRVTVNQWRGPAGRTVNILTTDYSAGEAHCPAYKNPPKFDGNDKVDPYGKRLCVEWECEHGRKARWAHGAHVMPAMHGELKPDACDVLASLLMDADVLNAGGFEEWANDCDYDTDSRKAEATYRECLGIALKLRNGLGESALAELREAAQDY